MRPWLLVNDKHSSILMYLPLLFAETKINRLRKEINRLSSKGMPNIYLFIFSQLLFSKFKKFVTKSVLQSSNSRRYR